MSASAYQAKLKWQQALTARGGGLLSISNAFTEYDVDNDGYLNWDQFCGALKKGGLNPSPQDVRTIFIDMDKNRDNKISKDEFISAFRGNTSQRKKDVISHIFRVIDSDRDGIVNMTNVGSYYMAKNHPDVVSGRKNTATVFKEFVDSLSTVATRGVLTLDQFLDYYLNAFAFDEDVKFDEFMFAVWNVPRLNSIRQGTSLSGFTQYDDKSSYSATNSSPAVTSPVLDKLRAQLIARGASGIIGLQRKFRIMDDDNDKSLNLQEFKKAIRECSLELNEMELSQLFSCFDTNRSGTISFDEFLYEIRGPMNNRRRQMVNLAFAVLDKDGSGVVDAGDIASSYNASKHPDVLAGKRTAEAVLREFLDTFDVGGVIDGKVTKEEFINYYTNISASIDNEDYFELMIRNAWHISGGEGQAANSANRRVLVTGADGSQYVQEIKSDMGLDAKDKAGMMARLKAQGVNASSISTFDGVDNTSPATAASRKYTNKSLVSSADIFNTNPPVDRPTSVFQTANKSMISNPALLFGPAAAVGQTQYAVRAPQGAVYSTNEAIALRSAPTSLIPAGILSIVTKMKAAMKNKAGNPGFIGLQRKFRIMDDDGSKTLNLGEFKKGLKELDFNLSDAEMRMLFEHFDTDRSGTVDFEEFIQGVRDPLTDRRRKLVDMAFAVLDKDGSGMVDAGDVASAYNASKHPEVLAGRMTSQQALSHFLETFDVGGVIDGKVTKEEFANYYTNLGASIDNEDYFELMIRNAWHISGGEGQAANSANRRVLVTGADGSQYVQEIKSDMGLDAKDKAGMMARLKAQGVNASSISTYDGVDNTSPAAGQRRGGAAQVNSLSNSLSNIRFEKAQMAAPSFDKPSFNPAQSVPIRGSSQNLLPAGILMIVSKMKTALKVKGAVGFIGLQRKFRIMDDDGSKTMNLGEFKKGLKELDLNLSDAEMRMLFEHFDTDRSGTVDFEEFIQGVRDPLTDRRRKLVDMAFAVLDKDGSGIVDATDIASTYDASKHPEVISGRMTAQQALSHFLETFDVGGVIDGKVTKEEFANYYTNLGASIDNEDYFELMIRNAWHISGGEGQAANSANRRVLVTGADGSQYVQEIKNDMGLDAKDKAGMMARLKAQGVNASSISTYDGVDNTTAAAGSRPTSLNVDTGPLSRRVAVSRLSSSNIGGLLPGSMEQETKLRTTKPVVDLKDASAGIRMIASRIKSELKARGSIGFIGLQRKFRIMDDDGSKALNLAEFKKGLKEMNINITDAEMRMVFYHFDIDKSGSIDFEEFIQGVRDPLTDRRRKLVDMAFAVLDKDGSGMVDATDIASSYNASNHPEVLAGRMTAQQALSHFLETFDVGGVIDGKVTKEEFANYYHNISSSIDNEDYFELMIRNAWHISGGEGQAANSANRRVLVTGADGSQYVQEIKSDMGLDPKDTKGMIARLKAQGINAQAVSVYDGVDNTTAAAGQRKVGGRPQTAPAQLIKKPAHMGSSINLAGEPSDFNGSSPNRSKGANYDHSASASSFQLAPKGDGSDQQQVAMNPLRKMRIESWQSSIGGSSYEVDKIVKDLRTELTNRGARGLIGLQRKFRIIDDNGDQALSFEEFSKGMAECNINLPKDQVKVLFKHFDRNNDNVVDFEEFLQALRGPLSPRRLMLIAQAFNIVDKTGDGMLEPSDIMGTYNASKHPDVLAGKRTAEAVLREFLDTFDVGGVIDGKVTKEEFINYYHNISASIDNEDYFELMIRNAWHISGGEGQAANSANRRVLVTGADGSQYVQEIKSDMGLDAKDKAGMMARLKAQGVNASSISTYDGVDNTDRAADGSPRKMDRSSSASVAAGFRTDLKFRDRHLVSAFQIADAAPEEIKTDIRPSKKAVHQIFKSQISI